MARSTNASDSRTPKEPGRLKQMWQVLRMTIRYDSLALPLLIGAFVIPVLVGVLLAFLLTPGQWLGMTLYIVTGVLAGVLFVLLVLGRRAEKAAYSQIAGQPGAVSAVIQTSLRGGWIGDSMPVAVSPKTQDAVYRIVGKGGIVLIAEGPASRTGKLIEEQRRIVKRIVPEAPVGTLQVGPDPDSIPLHRIPAELRRVKRALRKAEVRQISARLESLNKTGSLPIPKGIDPQRVRAQRPR